MPYYLQQSLSRSHKGFPEGMNLSMINDPHRLTKYNEYFKENAGGKVILDVGAGLGLIGLKALEYGASHVYLIEQNAHTVAALRKIVAALPDPGRATVIERDFHQLNRSDFHVSADLLVCELWGPHLWNEGVHATHLKAYQLFPEIDFYPCSYKSEFNIVRIPPTEQGIWPREQLADVSLLEIYKQEYLGHLLDRHGVQHIDLTGPVECFSLNGEKFTRNFETIIDDDYSDVFFNLTHYIQWNDHLQKWRNTYFYVPEISRGTRLTIALDEVYLPVFSV
jgi:16S rRNA G966 N2-methylase RsmD